MGKPFEKRLIIASNRGPYRLKNGRYERTVGGLVAALDPVMRSAKGVWIAAGSERECGRQGLRIALPPENPSYVLRKVPLAPAEVEGYYNGYCNRLLWPLCHMVLDRVRLESSYWESYKKVNRLFAGAVLEEAGKDAAVWLQDYHLALSAKSIKSRRPGLTVSIFWHIPWPPHALFRICPQRKEILEGLLANDLIGFQLDKFRVCFMECVGAELDADLDAERGLISFKGHTTRLRAFPIGMDFKWFEKAARAEEADRFIERFVRKRGLRGITLGIGVNRLDYTKGLIKCLDILDRFFEMFHEYRKRITFIQVCVPTRKSEPYLSYSRLVKRRAAGLNRKYGAGGWRPVVYIGAELNHSELAALYRESAVAVISSVYDGMNLVAKEYLASQVSLRGTALVSELAGVADDVPGITAINPYDTDSSALAIKKALETRPSARKRALSLARDYLRKNDIYKWVGDVLREIGKIRAGKKYPGTA